MELLVTRESYSLDGIWESCTQFIKKKYPKPVENESIDDYKTFISCEIKLEMAHRLRIIADDLEEIANERKCY